MKNPITLMTQSASNFLRSAAAKIMYSYEQYLIHERKGTEENPYDPYDPKNFKAFHDAGKSAATHLETVLKIGNNTDVKDSNAEEERAEMAKEYDQVQHQIRHLHKKKKER